MSDPERRTLEVQSLEVSGFRGLQRLRVDRLDRVNLVVGKNNVGKSTLLEAVRLYAARGEFHTIRSLLLHRGELADDSSPSRDPLQVVSAFRTLFYESVSSEATRPRCTIGPATMKARQLTLELDWAKPDPSEQLILPSTRTEADDLLRDRPILTVKFGSVRSAYPLDEDPRYLPRHIARRGDSVKRKRCVNVPATGLSVSQTEALWDSIALTDLEESVLEGLRIIAPEIERLSLVATRRPTGSERQVVVRHKRFRRPIPLRSMGDGVNRMLGIALALVSAKDGILLIDEMENGFHYTAQYDLWKLVFKLAHQLNVQVFATSHSDDCVLAFQKAAIEAKQVDGLLVRLQRDSDLIRSVPFDEKELMIAKRRDLEVR